MARGGGKLVDAATLKRLRAKTLIHKFSDMAAEGGTLQVDVTQLSPEEAAMRIFRHVLEACPEVESDVSNHFKTQMTTGTMANA